MPILALAVLFIVVQTSPPVPRNAINNSTGNPQSVKTNANSNKTPSAKPEALPGPVAPKPEREAAARPQRQYDQQPVAISKLPPVSVNRDWADWAYWLFSGLLAIVGLLQVWLLHGTLRAAEGNAKAASDNAEAAKNAVAAMQHANQINRESLQAVQRAYISFPILDVQVLAMTDFTGKVANWQLRTAIENTGNTPAVEMTHRINFHCIDGQQELPEDFTFPDYGEAAVYVSTLAAKARTYSAKLTIDDIVVRRLYQGQARLYVYGWVSYRDMFDNTPTHCTRFCHEIRVVRIAGNELMLEITAYRRNNTQS